MVHSPTSATTTHRDHHQQQGTHDPEAIKYHYNVAEAQLNSMAEHGVVHRSNCASAQQTRTSSPRSTDLWSPSGHQNQPVLYTEKLS